MPIPRRAEIPALERRLVPIGLMLYFVFALVVATCSPGTYDAGDSVMHFLIAKWAPQHPDLFLSHWGKPMFTLLASPFAQLGFGGMKLLQCLLVTACGWMLWRSAHHLGLKFAWLAPIFAFAGPEFFLAQLSGLTEPLFAFTLLLGVYLWLQDRTVFAAIALSLLPYVRTEGFVLLPVFFVYALIRQEWKAIPWLGLGTVVMMLVGGLAKGNLFWIWTENPYLSEQLYYGRGDLMHFPKYYLFLSGIPVYVLTILGLVLPPLRLLLRRTSFHWPMLVLVVGPWAAFLAAHIYFWAFGVGHSMGLLRVLICILPLGALIALNGLNALLDFLPTRPSMKIALLVPILAYVVAFPVLPNPAAIHAKDLQLTVDQTLVQAAMAWTAAQGLTSRKMYSAHPSAGLFTTKDPFDGAEYGSLLILQHQDPEKGALILWDSWFARVEAGYHDTDFESRPEAYRMLQTWMGMEGNTPIKVALYEKI